MGHGMQEPKGGYDGGRALNAGQPGEGFMKRWEAIDWWIAVISPLGCLLIAVPLFAALNHVSTRVQTGSASPTAWLDAQHRADQAIAAGRPGDAIRAWHEAYAEALASRQWLAMVEVGDLSIRIGNATGSQTAARTRARECYWSALLRARRDGALEGVLRIAEAFARLGDREVAQQALELAGTLAERRSPEARERYRSTVERLRIQAFTLTGAAR